jgi:hypothetical protein
MARLDDILKVLRVLEQQRAEGPGWTWVRRLAKQAKLHHEVVRRIVDGYLSEAIEVADADALIGEGLRIKPMRLKDGVTARGHLRYLRAMGKLRD